MEPLNLRDRIARAKRAPCRITITVSNALYGRLVSSSFEQGRSISNLCAYLLEVAMPES
jgi:hypothetical protein